MPNENQHDPTANPTECSEIKFPNPDTEAWFQKCKKNNPLLTPEKFMQVRTAAANIPNPSNKRFSSSGTVLSEKEVYSNDRTKPYYSGD